MSQSSNRVMLALAAGLLCGSSTALVAMTERAGTADPERTSYAIGYDLGRTSLERLRLDEVEVDQDALIRGFEDAVAEAEPAYEPAEINAALAVLQREVATRHAEARLASDPVFRAMAEQNMSESAAFLASFAEDEASQELPGGVVYRVVHEGEGPSPEATDIVTVSFIARLRDGTLIGDQDAMSVEVDGMLAGAQEAIQSMRVGSRWIIAIPPEQAFGLGGRAPEIGPNEVIFAEVELLGIEP